MPNCHENRGPNGWRGGGRNKPQILQIPTFWTQKISSNPSQKKNRTAYIPENIFLFWYHVKVVDFRTPSIPKSGAFLRRAECRRQRHCLIQNADGGGSVRGRAHGKETGRRGGRGGIFISSSFVVRRRPSAVQVKH